MSSQNSPLGPVWVRVIACLFGMGCFPGMLIAMTVVSNQWIAIAALPSSVSVFLYSAHTLHTGHPPPMRPLLRYMIDAITRWYRKK
jgi:hypothetical protein